MVKVRKNILSVRSSRIWVGHSHTTKSLRVMGGKGRLGTGLGERMTVSQAPKSLRRVGVGTGRATENSNEGDLEGRESNSIHYKGVVVYEAVDTGGQMRCPVGSK